MIKKVKKTSNIKLSSHFNSNEFDCHGRGCCSVTKYDTKLIEILEDVRNHFGKSVRITSGYRCSTHNSKVGGNPNSSHKLGQAADIVISGVKPIEVAKYCESKGVKKLGVYSGGWTHIGSGSSKDFWKDSTHGVDTFGGNTFKKPKRTIKKGCKGEDVKWVQYWLKDKGLYKGNIDGDCGIKTVKSINLFRLRNGWKETGYLKSKGFKALEK